MKRTTHANLKTASRILREIRYAVVATSDAQGQPWVSPVYVVWDSQLRGYWFSDQASRHGRNVRERPEAAVVVFDSTVPEGQGMGVYMKGTVRQLERSDRSVIESVRRIKKGDLPDGDLRRFTGAAARRVYEFTPTAAWVNGVQIREGRFVRDVRLPIDLDKLRLAAGGGA